MQSDRRIVPLRLKDADEFIRTWHRDHKNHNPSRFHRFSLGLLAEDKLVGAIIVGYPMARATDRMQVAEVNRLAADGTRDACSMLLGRAVRVARDMGFARLQMFVEPTEIHAPSFLKAANFHFDGETSGNQWDHDRKGDNRKRRPSPKNPKHRWVFDLRTGE